jgi:hypothetical protein
MQDNNSAERVLMRASSADSAIEFLHGGETLRTDHVAGPVRIGDVAGVREESLWKLAAQHYARGFKNGESVFPYFSPKR